MAARPKHRPRKTLERLRRAAGPAVLRVAAATVLATAATAGVARAQDATAPGVEAGAPAGTSAPTRAQAEPGTGNGPQPAPGEVGATPFAGAATAAPGAQQPPWIFVPSIGLEETATDNVRSSTTNRQSDLVSTISPSIFAGAQSRRIQGAFDYAPQILRHVEATDQDSVVQNLLGNGTLHLVPDFLFLDANASISDQSRSGSQGFGNTNEIPTGQQTQQIAYSASPYARFHLGDMATAQLRYRVSQSRFSGNTGAIASSVTGQQLSALSNATEQEGTANVSSGSDFARLSLTATGDYVITNYTQSTLSSRSASGTLNASYLVTRAIYALASGGYQRLTYPHESNLDVTGPTWSAGARYEPNEKQSVSLTYGRQDGENGFTGLMLYALTPATTVSAAYTKTRATTQQQILQNLQTTTPTQTGTPINTATGLPLSITNPNLPLQNDILLSQNLQAGVTQQLGRDSISLVATYVKQSSLLHLSPNLSSTGGFLTWAHQLTERAVGDVLVGYSTTSPGASHVVTFSSGIGYQLGPTLEASIRYDLVDSGGGTTGNVGGGVLTNSLTLGIAKTF